MQHDVEQRAASAVWQALLEMRRFLRSSAAEEHGTVELVREDSGWRFSPSSTASSPRVLRIPLSDEAERTLATSGTADSYSHARFVAGEDPIVRGAGGLDPSFETILRLYLPSLIGGYRARRSGKAFVLAHIAQTLDGRIACRNGHSQWISNQANLFHAHRLRALHDAVLVGSRTVSSDDPQLTVRHVEGDDPVRVVLSAGASVLRAPEDFKIFGGAGCTVLCDPSVAGELSPNGRHARVDVLPVGCDASGRIAPDSIGSALAARGIHSIFVEGGGRTLSSFLERSALDVLHVHIAPVVLGSGIPGFRLPEVETIQAGRRLVMEQYSMEGEVLLECREAGGEA